MMSSPALDELRRFVHASLLDPAVESDADTDEKPVRRMVVCAATLLVGALTLRWSLGVAPGDALFYPATAGLALVWLGVRARRAKAAPV